MLMQTRLDYNIDPEVIRWIVYEATHLINDAQTKEYDEFTLNDLVEALIAKGAVRLTDEETLARHYTRYYYYGDQHEVLRMTNYDFMLEGARNDIQITIAGYRTRIWAPSNRYTLMELVDFFVKLDSDMPKLVERGMNYVKNIRKKEKILEINQNTVSTIVKTTLEGTGIEYKLDLYKQQAFLTLYLNHKLETKVRLPYKDFMSKIKHVEDMVHQLNELMDIIGQPIRIKGRQ